MRSPPFGRRQGPALSRRIAAAIVLSTLFSGAAAACLPDALRANQAGIFLDGGTSGSFPLRFQDGNRAASQLLTRIASIISEEYLGYAADVAPAANRSDDAISSTLPVCGTSTTPSCCAASSGTAPCVASTRLAAGPHVALGLPLGALNATSVAALGASPAVDVSDPAGFSAGPALRASPAQLIRAQNVAGSPIASLTDLVAFPHALATFQQLSAVSAATRAAAAAVCDALASRDGAQAARFCAPVNGTKGFAPAASASDLAIGNVSVVLADAPWASPGLADAVASLRLPVAVLWLGQRLVELGVAELSASGSATLLFLHHPSPATASLLAPASRARSFDTLATLNQPSATVAAPSATSGGCPAAVPGGLKCFYDATQTVAVSVAGLRSAAPGVHALAQGLSISSGEMQSVMVAAATALGQSSAPEPAATRAALATAACQWVTSHVSEWRAVVDPAVTTCSRDAWRLSPAPTCTADRLSYTAAWNTPSSRNASLPAACVRGPSLPASGRSAACPYPDSGSVAIARVLSILAAMSVCMIVGAAWSNAGNRLGSPPPETIALFLMAAIVTAIRPFVIAPDPSAVSSGACASDAILSIAQTRLAGFAVLAMGVAVWRRVIGAGARDEETEDSSTGDSRRGPPSRDLSQPRDQHAQSIRVPTRGPAGLYPGVEDGSAGATPIPDASARSQSAGETDDGSTVSGASALQRHPMSSHYRGSPAFPVRSPHSGAYRATSDAASASAVSGASDDLTQDHDIAFRREMARDMHMPRTVLHAHRPSVTGGGIEKPSSVASRASRASMTRSTWRLRQRRAVIPTVHDPTGAAAPNMVEVALQSRWDMKTVGTLPAAEELRANMPVAVQAAVMSTARPPVSVLDFHGAGCDAWGTVPVLACIVGVALGAGLQFAAGVASTDANELSLSTDDGTLAVAVCGPAFVPLATALSALDALLAIVFALYLARAVAQAAATSEWSRDTHLLTALFHIRLSGTLFLVLAAVCAIVPPVLASVGTVPAVVVPVSAALHAVCLLPASLVLLPYVREKLTGVDPAGPQSPSSQNAKPSPHGVAPEVSFGIAEPMSPDGLALGSFVANSHRAEVLSATWNAQDVAVKRFERCAKVHDPLIQYLLGVHFNSVQALRHPHITQTHGFIIGADSDLMVVSDFAARGSLRDVLSGGVVTHPADWRVLLGVVTDAAEALAFLHGNPVRPILHGAITPWNVLVDSSCRGRLADVGGVVIRDILFRDDDVQNPDLLIVRRVQKSRGPPALSAAKSAHSQSAVSAHAQSPGGRFKSNRSQYVTAGAPAAALVMMDGEVRGEPDALGGRVHLDATAGDTVGPELEALRAATANAHKTGQWRARRAPVATNLVKGAEYVALRPEYMAPEVLRGDEHTKAADVYALGALIFEALAFGHAPYSSLQRVAVPLAIMRARGPEEFVSVPEHPFATAALFRTMRACLDPDPAVRPTARAVLKDLVEFGAGMLGTGQWRDEPMSFGNGQLSAEMMKLLHDAAHRGSTRAPRAGGRDRTPPRSPSAAASRAAHGSRAPANAKQPNVTESNELRSDPPAKGGNAVAQPSADADLDAAQRRSPVETQRLGDTECFASAMEQVETAPRQGPLAQRLARAASNGEEPTEGAAPAVAENPISTSSPTGRKPRRLEPIVRPPQASLKESPKAQSEAAAPSTSDEAAGKDEEVQVGPEEGMVTLRSADRKQGPGEQGWDGEDETEETEDGDRSSGRQHRAPLARTDSGRSSGKESMSSGRRRRKRHGRREGATSPTASSSGKSRRMELARRGKSVKTTVPPVKSGAESSQSDRTDKHVGRSTVAAAMRAKEDGGVKKQDTSEVETEGESPMNHSVVGDLHTAPRKFGRGARAAPSIASSGNSHRSVLMKRSELQIEGELGAGMFGKVYKGTLRGEKVAVKQMTIEDTPKARRTFRRECSIMSRLSHPNIVCVKGTIEEERTMMLVMELVPRGDLFNMIRRSSRTARPLDHICFCTMIAGDIASGMRYLHAATPPIVHRDLKSMNILLGDSWEAKITDFGMSKVLDDSTVAMTRCGSPAWAAPEVLRGENYDVRADIYSFGVILCELFGWCEPYARTLNHRQLLRGVADGTVRPHLSSRWPKDVRNVVQSCLLGDPAQRPSFATLQPAIKELRALANAQRKRAGK